MVHGIGTRVTSLENMLDFLSGHPYKQAICYFVFKNGTDFLHVFFESMFALEDSISSRTLHISIPIE